MKVEAAALYLSGMDETWYNSLVFSRGIVTWAKFKEELCIRFEETLTEDRVEEFNRLTQTGSVKELLSKFENLKAQMIMTNPTLNESHFLCSFVGTLKEEIKYAVKMFKLATFSFIIEQARMQENALEAVQKREKPVTKDAHSSVSNTAHTPSTLAAHRPATYRLSPELYEYRKSNHLYYRCGQTYTTRHRCKNKQLKCIIGKWRSYCTWCVPCHCNRAATRDVRIYMFECKVHYQVIVLD